MVTKIRGLVKREIKLSFPFRILLCGSSGSGKTHFAGELLRQSDLFEEKVSNVSYFYPPYLPGPPVDWHKKLKIPVSYQIGLPSQEYLMAQPKNSCIVVDDSFDKALESSVIDHLFRVISGKVGLSVILMSQNLFSKGKFGRDIRNSSNFIALFRNCADSRLNLNLARMVGLQKAFEAARMELDGKMFPVMFLDLSQKGQLSPYRLYTKIFGKYKIAFSNTGMKGYIINENDFESYFKVSLGAGNNFEAEKNENPSSKIERSIRSENQENSNTEKSQINENPVSIQRSKNKEKIERRYRRKPVSGPIHRWKKRSEYNLSKFKKHTKLFRKNK